MARPLPESSQGFLDEAAVMLRTVLTELTSDVAPASLLYANKR